MVLGGDGEPIKRGFFCNDETIKYPAPKKETVPMSLCMIIWFAITISTIIFVEVISFGTIKSQKLSLPLPFKVNIQLLTFAYIRLLNKPYENEVTLTGQNLP